jgi:hypothetical protein
LFSVTDFGPSVTGPLKLLSPAFDAEIEQLPLASLTLITPDEEPTEQPVEPVELNVTAPPPEPPVVVAVPVLPNVMLPGTLNTNGCWFCFPAATVNVCEASVCWFPQGTEALVQMTTVQVPAVATARESLKAAPGTPEWTIAEPTSWPLGFIHNTSMSPLFPFEVPVMTEWAQAVSPLLNEVEAVEQSLFRTETVAAVAFASVNVVAALSPVAPVAVTL